MTVNQKAILSVDESETSSNDKTAKKISKSRRKTSLDEFSLRKSLRPEVKAGFRVWLRGDEHHFDNEWEDLFKTYMSR